MKRNTMTQSLKRALAFALFCLCIFVYSQQASVLGSAAVQGDEHKCCRSCGSVEACKEGLDWLQWGYEHCEINLHTPPLCEVSRNYCECDL
jgi:hypothetical protein